MILPIPGHKLKLILDAAQTGVTELGDGDTGISKSKLID